MECWDGTVLDTNATCNRLGLKCLQLIGMHALTGCDTTSGVENVSGVEMRRIYGE